jgi:hypothetical protein
MAAFFAGNFCFVVFLLFHPSGAACGLRKGHLKRRYAPLAAGTTIFEEKGLLDRRKRNP